MKNQIPFAFDIPSVSELTEQIKSVLEHKFRDILVEGELSNINKSRNGHIYFTVKDSDAQLPCVIWRSTVARLDIDIRDGQQVVLGGDLQVYAPHGRYQMIVTLVQQAGIGKLQQKFEELKQKLEKEGLFRDSAKKPLPPFPLSVGVITSSTGAAFHDIRSTFEKRWPVATLYLHHASVQGLSAAGEIARAIRYFSEQANPVDILIIGRGGGSLEDLWPFNEEIVARAIFDCPIPMISAVGHEVDFSISDFVADQRAATPTQAVILATPDINELRYQVDDYTTKMETILDQHITGLREYVHRLAHSHALLAVRDKLQFFQSRVENLHEKLLARHASLLFERNSVYQQLTSSLENKNPSVFIHHQNRYLYSLLEKLDNTFKRMILEKKSALHTKISDLEEQNPKTPLERGFTRILQNGKWIRSKQQYQPEKPTDIEWKDGTISR